MVGRSATMIVILLLGCAAPAAGYFQEDFEERFFEESDSVYAKDHALIRGPDGRHHLVYIAGHAGQGWSEPGNEVDFGHASSSDLKHWTVHPRILSIDPAHGWKSRNMWAPHVIELPPAAGGGYLMAYTGVDSSINQQIGVAVSADLFTWTDLSVEAAAYHPDTLWATWSADSAWSHCRDPFILELDDSLALLATAKTRPGYLGLPARGAVALAYSAGGRQWTDDGAPLIVNDSWSLMESGHLARNPATGSWFLFYTRTEPPGGVHYLKSSSPTAGWEMATNRILDAAAIASEIEDEQWIYSSVVSYRGQDGEITRSVRFDSLAWGIDDEPEVVRADGFWRRWMLISGDLHCMPTFRDRPAYRSGIPSNVQGTFWVNTAEPYAGPFGGGCAVCWADESLTGVLRSSSFTISGGTIELMVGGSFTDDAYVALVDSLSGAVLHRAGGGGSDVMTRREWAVGGMRGMRVYIEIVDHDPAGHVSVDTIRELPGFVDVGEPAGRHDVAGADPGGSIGVWPNPAGAGAPVWIGSELLLGVTAEVTIHDVQGRLVRRLRPPAAAATTRAGGRACWATDLADGRPAPRGVYFIHIRSGADGRPAAGAKVVVRR